MNNLYNKWINNARSGNEISYILILCLEDKSMIKIIENDIKGISNVTLLSLRKITKKILNQGNNLIAYSVKEFSLGHLQVFSNDQNIQISFLKMLHQNDNYIDLANVNNPRLNKEESIIMIHSFDLDWRDPISTISFEGIDYLKQFIANFITNNNSCTASKKSIQAFLYRSMRNILNETILRDIEFLQHRAILTSRLAIFIYKICTFDYDASDKIIGLYFSKYYGRSRVVNGKSFGVENVKGYIIKDINFQEQQIRNDIANRLHRLRVSNDIIAQATGVQY